MLKKSLLALCALLTAIPLWAWNVDGIEYNIIDETAGTVEVVELPSGEYSGEINIPESVEYDGKTFTVTRIGEFAFFDCDGLTDVTIPNSVTSIFDYAFIGCTGLTEVTIPNSVTSIGYAAFSDCNITTLTLIDGEKGIAFGEDTFADVPLETLYIGRNFDNSQRIFKDCVTITSLTFGNTVTTIAESAFSGCSGLTELSISNSVTSIGRNAFSGCTGLAELTIPNSVIYISEYAFSGCAGLAELTIPNSVKDIYGYAFSGCSGLAELTIPNSVKCIYEYAYSGCAGLAELTIPNSVNFIGNQAFGGCTLLTTVILEDGSENIKLGDDAFSGAPIETLYIGRNFDNSKKTFTDCATLTSLTFGNTVTQIGNDLFSYCSNLKTVAFADGKGDITFGQNVFKETPIETLYMGRNFTTPSFYSPFRSLRTLTIGDSVTAISPWAFSYCSGLTELTIPNSVVSIGEYAFYGCPGPTELILPASVTFIGEKALDCENLKKIAVPAECTLQEWTHGSVVRYDSEDNLIENGLIYNRSKTKLYYVSINKEGSFTIPETVNTIGDGAFADCYNLTEIVALPTVAPTNYQNSFYGSYNDFYKNVTLSIPGGSVQSYLATDYWRLFTNIQSEGIDCVASTGGFEYIFDPVSKEATLVGVDNTSATDIEIPSRVKLGDTRYDITAIGQETFLGSALQSITFGSNIKAIFANAFNGCKSLTSITLPSSVITIGRSAFENCYNLSSIIFDDSLSSIGDRAFYGCKGLTEITLSKNVTEIGASAFEGCTSIANVTLPTIDVRIGDRVFYNLSKLYSITPINATTIGREAFYATKLGSVEVKADSIGEKAFADCTSLVAISVDCPEIGDAAFAGCKSLSGASVNCPAISNSLFEHCSQLRAYDFKGVKTIGEKAFYSTRLSEVEIPASVQSIGDKAFGSCKALEKFVISEGPDNVTLAASFTADASLKDLVIGRNCSDWSNFKGLGIKSLAIGNQVTGFPADIFQNCTALESLTLGSGITEIPASAFKGCSALQEVVIPRGVTTIGERAFNGCSSLGQIAIGCGVSEIGASAFYAANDVAKVCVAAVTPPAASENSFSKYNAPLYLPEQSIDDYDKSPYCWSAFFDYKDPFKLVEITKLTIDGADAIANMQPGQSAELTATIAPEDATLPYVFWRSTNPAIATVDNYGNVTYMGCDTESDECQIIAETMYANGPVASVTISKSATGINIITNDDNDISTEAYGNCPAGIYNLQGICLKRSATDADIKALPVGIYIANGKKIIVR